MNCPVCNRPLKSKKSIERGIGPVCASKLEKLEENSDGNQLKLDLKVKE